LKKKVYSSHNAVLVHHSRNLLEAEGIGTEVRNEYLSSAMGELPPAECQAQVWVSEKDVARAEAILQRPAPAGPDRSCPGCGETSGAQFSHCWSCGRLLADPPA
jgi:hypothetical protein